ncbi:MAG TPA: hypothetical protein VIU61_04155, partial [Kofleriaceae bacterium]
MSSSEGGGKPPGKPPGPPASSTLAGMPAPRERPPLPKPRGSGTIPPPTTAPRPFQPPPRPSQPAAPAPPPVAPPPSGPVPHSVHTQPTTPSPAPPQGTVPGFGHLSGPQPQALGGDPTLPTAAPAPFAPQPSAPTPLAPDPAWALRGRDEPEPQDSLEEVPGSAFVKFLKISSKRAFRLRIEPAEVLASERRSLHAANPPIVDPNLQAFLAWRRSVLFLVACALVPLALVGAIDAFTGTMAGPIRFVKGVPVIAEIIFAYVCWSQLKQWTHWRTQRRKLLWAWLLFMLTPFIVFLYPLRSVFEGLATSPRENLA